MRVLITGGAGGLGISTCKAFLKDGFNVRVLDLDSPINQKRVRGLGANAETVWGDITEPDVVKKAMEGVDAAVHLAAIILPSSESNPELTARVNVGGTQTITDIIKKKGERIPFVFTSSCGVFGPTPDATGPLHPDRNPRNPKYVYDRTKAQAEDVIVESGIDYVILRPTLIPHLNVVANLTSSDTKFYMFRIPLRNRIEFTHPDDVALAILNSVKGFDAVKGSILMIAGGASQRMLYQDVLRAMLGTLGLPLPPSHKFSEEPLALDWYDTESPQALLNFQQKTLDDYCKDLADRFPVPVVALMRYFIGPVFGRLIVRFM